MPFEKVDPIAEAIELQEEFKDDPETRMLYDLTKLRDKVNPEFYHNPLQISNRMLSKKL